MMKRTVVKPGIRAGKCRGARWRTLLIPTLVGLPVIVVLAWLLLRLTPEPLTSEEILEKQEWSERELTS